MASRIKGITVQIGAETTGLEKALKDVNQSSRDIQKELREVDRLLKFNPKDTELLTQKQKLLGDQVSVTKEKLDKLKAAEKGVQDQLKRGDIGEDQYRAFQREIVETESKLKRYEGQLKDVATAQGTLKDKLNETASSLKTAGEKMTNAGQTLTMGVTAPLVAGFGLAVEGTRELRQEMSKLENNAVLAGASIDITKAAMRELSIYSDDTGANVEAVSNLLAAGFKDESLTGVIESLSGAVLKFPDTLKIEGLADGLQETLATGAAVGPFSELLERMGVDLETFNTGLAEAAVNGEEQNYVMQELAKLGLTDVSEAYKKNNEELVKSAEAQYDLKDSLSELGETLEPVMTKITGAVTGVVEAFNSLSPGTQSFILGAAGVVAGVGPVLLIFGKLAGAVSAIIGLFGGGAAVAGAAGAAGAAGGGLAAAFAVITGPIGIAVAAVAGLVAIGVTLYKNWDTIKEKAGELKDKLGETWENVKTKTSETWEGIKEKTSETWNSMKESVSEKWDSVKQKTSETWDNIKEKTSTAWGNIKDKVDENGGGIEGVLRTYADGYKLIWETGFTKLDEITGGKLTAIKDKLGGKLEDMKTSISNAVQRFKELFNFDWSLPKIKVPTFSITGKFSLDPPSIPKIGINWNAEGAIFTKPYVFGNQGFGEAGPEAVLPIEKLGSILADTMNRMGSQTGVIRHDHSGTIRFEGVNDRSQMVGVVDAVMEQLRREARTR